MAHSPEASSHIIESSAAEEAGTDQAISSESVRVESKVFYVDLKQNVRGRYLKLSEKGFNRPRSTIIVPQPGLPWFVKLFDYYLTAPGQPLNKELVVENKVFYFSVGENPRGRYLRVSESGLGNTAGRSSLVIPSAGHDDDGWAIFRDSIKRVCQLDDEPSSKAVDVEGARSVVGPGPSPPQLLTTSGGSPVLRVGQKRFFFDLGDNDKGAYLKVTEVVGDERNSLFIPFVAVATFQEALAMCAAAGEAQQGVPSRPGQGLGQLMRPQQQQLQQQQQPRTMVPQQQQLLQQPLAHHRQQLQQQQHGWAG